MGFLTLLPHMCAHIYVSNPRSLHTSMCIDLASREGKDISAQNFPTTAGIVLWLGHPKGVSGRSCLRRNQISSHLHCLVMGFKQTTHGFIWPGFVTGRRKLTGILSIEGPESEICDVNNLQDMAEIQMRFLPATLCSSSTCSTNSSLGSQFQVFSKKDALNSDQAVTSSY